jgi:type IV pilus assembly protein PilQ
MLKRLHIIILLLICLQGLRAQNGQERIQIIRGRLEELVKRDSSFASVVNISAGNLTLSDLLRHIAKAGNVNLSVREETNLKVSCNFLNIKIYEILLVLCKDYSLDLDITGNVVSVFPYKTAPPLPKQPVITYNKKDSTISYDFSDEPLINITKEITKQSGINIIVPQSLYNKKISGYVTGMHEDIALDAISRVNNLQISKNRNKRVWTISEAKEGEGEIPLAGDGQIEIDSMGNLSVMIHNGNIYNLVEEACEKLGLSRHFITPVNAPVSLFLKKVPADIFFNTLFAGTPFSYYKENDIYYFGTSAKEKNLTSVSVLPLKYRSVDKISDLIPSQLKQDLQIVPYVEMNSVIICGEQKAVARIENLIKSLDKSIPLITIDVIIVEVKKSRNDETGIKAGSSAEAVTTTGTLDSGLDWTLNATSINRIINSFNGFGSIKLGQVSPNFYINLKLLESKGEIRLESTPKLSTLNGHEAILTSGETKYYKEVNNSYMGTQNPVQLSSYTWKSIDASLTVKITPYVSEENKITLNIDISESEFTEREEEEAPPGTTSRSFKSIIRVENEEVVLLGGIERNKREKSSEGLPFIARVPVLKWLFGSTADNKSEHKLNVFIKPTIIN